MDLPTTTAHPGPVPVDWVPVAACTLPTAEQPLRVAEFDALFASALRTVELGDPAASRVRLVLAGDMDLPDRVQRLADAETACCSFFSFRVTPLSEAPADDTTVVALDVEVPLDRAGVLAALVQRAAAARRPSA
jgi:hypothetical protein